MCTICGGASYLFFDNLFDDRYGAAGSFSIYCCRQCGFGKTYPSLKREEIGKLYAKHYPLKKYTPEAIESQVDLSPKWWGFICGQDNIAHWYITAGKDVLDIGCGAGVSLLEIEALGAKAYGVEPNPKAQEVARKLNLNVYHGFITDNPFPQKKFDYITASQVLEHDPEPKLFLNSCYKLLKPSGQVILSFPNFNSVYRKILGRYWLNWHVPYHINFFTEESFKKLARSCGFKTVKMRTITPNLWTLLQLQMLLVKIPKGRASPIWQRADNSADLAKKSKTNIEKITKRILLSGFLLFFSIFNRPFDLLNQGDSFLVILTKKKK